MTARHLAVAFPREGAQRLVLLDSTGTQEVRAYEGHRSFRRIEHDGRWYRLAGVDRQTGEMCYLDEDGSAA